MAKRTVDARARQLAYEETRITRAVAGFEGGAKFVIVAKFHHNTAYYDATTPEDLFASALALLRAFVVGQELTFDADAGPPPGFTREEIQDFPEGAVRHAALTEWDAYDHRIASAEDDARKKAWIDEVLAAGDGRRAYVVLNDLCGNRYGESPGFRLECLVRSRGPATLLRLSDDWRHDEPAGYAVFARDQTVEEYQVFPDARPARDYAGEQREAASAAGEEPGDWPVYPLYAGDPLKDA